MLHSLSYIFSSVTDKKMNGQTESLIAYAVLHYITANSHKQCMQLASEVFKITKNSFQALSKHITS